MNNLIKVLTDEILSEKGFICHPDTDDPRGTYWEKKANGFCITIDAWADVTLTHNDSDTIGIKVHDLFDLSCLLSFIDPELP